MITDMSKQKSRKIIAQTCKKWLIFKPKNKIKSQKKICLSVLRFSK
jgi:hypothetical protein